MYTSRIVKIQMAIFIMVIYLPLSYFYHLLKEKDKLEKWFSPSCRCYYDQFSL